MANQQVMNDRQTQRPPASMAPRISDVLTGVAIFLFFNLIVAGIYFHVINP